MPFLNWKSKMVVYLDLDGVLADFDGSAQKLFGCSPNEFEMKKGIKEFWNTIFSDKEFFLTLQPLAEYKLLVKGCQELGFTPIILTGLPQPRTGIDVADQKRKWVNKFLGCKFNVITCMASQKAEFCKDGDVLVDDRIRYQKKWEKAGGKFIVHRSIPESLNQLSRYVQRDLFDAA